MKKKSSPIVEMTEQILDEIQTHNVLVQRYKNKTDDMLFQVEWNLLQPHEFNKGQALGMIRGFRLALGKDIAK